MVYPFLPVVAHGLGLSFRVVAGLVAARSLAGLAGPVVARGVQRVDLRASMLVGLAATTGGCLLVVVPWPGPAALRLWLIAAGFVATGMARPLFDVPLQAWIRAAVPAHARGRAVGLAEVGWPLSLLVTVPAAGLVVVGGGWRSPFLLVAGLGIVATVVVVRAVPARSVAGRQGSTAAVPTRQFGPTGGTHRSVTAGVRMPSAVAVYVAAALVVASGEVFFVVYGEWLAVDLRVSVAGIGISVLAIVAAELVGDGLVSATADRVGPSRLAIAAAGVAAAAHLALGMVGASVVAAVVVTAVVFVAFEVAVVSLLTVASLVPATADEGPRVFGRLVGAVAVGNAVGAVLAPVLFVRGGIALVGATAAAATAAGLVVLGWSTRRVEPTAVGVRRSRGAPTPATAAAWTPPRPRRAWRLHRRHRP